jgi:hypothetical protein
MRADRNSARRVAAIQPMDRRKDERSLAKVYLFNKPKGYMPLLKYRVLSNIAVIILLAQSSLRRPYVTKQG